MHVQWIFKENIFEEKSLRGTIEEMLEELSKLRYEEFFAHKSMWEKTIKRKGEKEEAVELLLKCPEAGN